MQQEKVLLYLGFNPKKKEIFFNNLRAMYEFYNKDLDTYITEDLLRYFKEKSKKQFKDATVNKITLKLKEEKIDIIYDPKTNLVIEIGFGSFSNPKRKIFKPYKRKQPSRKLYMSFKK